MTSSFVNSVPIPLVPEFNWVELKIGDEIVKTWDDVQTSPVSHEVRFASTHFADGTTKNITLRGEFHGWKNTNPLEEFTEIFTATLPATIYNKVLALTTVEQFIPESADSEPPIPAHYSKPGDADYPNPPHVANAAKRIVDDAIIKLTGTAMNHSLVPGNGDGTNWREFTGTAILSEKMCLATLFFTCTHGEVSLWRASHTDELTYSPFLSNDVKTYVTSKPDLSLRDVPDYTLAIFYSCETLVNSNNNPRAFQLSPDVLYPNKAYVGSGAHLHYQLWTPVPEELDEHSKRLTSFLAAGDPLEIALYKTQSPLVKGFKKAKTTAGGPVDLTVRGDPYARIVNVYLSQSEFAAAPAEVRNSWFWVKY